MGIVSTSLRSPDQCSIGAWLLTYGFDCCCALTLKTKIVDKLKTIASLFISYLLETGLKASDKPALKVLEIHHDGLRAKRWSSANCPSSDQWQNFANYIPFPRPLEGTVCRRFGAVARKF